MSQSLLAGGTLTDRQFHPPPIMPSYPGQPSPGSTPSIHDRHLERPHTYDALLAANSSLRTRVNELEVINDLFRGRVAQLEHELNAKRDEATQTESDNQLRNALHEAERREMDLKRRLDELENELKESSGPRAKKMRLSDMVHEGEPSTPQSVTS